MYAKLLLTSLGFYYVYAPSIETDGNGARRQYGNCIISRFPIIQYQKYFLSPNVCWDGKDAETEPRTLLATSIKVSDKILCFMTTHLAYSREFVTTDVKMKQIKTIARIIRKNEDYPLVLLGDFNSLLGSQEIKEIEKYLVNTDKVEENKTWTMRDFDFQGWEVPKGLKYKIDYVFLSKNIKYENLEIPETNISDHLPVLLTIRV